MGWRRSAAGALLVALAVPTAAASATDSGSFRLADPRITESSGLADVGPWVATTNDSGNPSDIFLLDPRTGRTVGVTHFHAPTVDVEALAPAGGNRVWVGDIGDNDRKRSSITLYRVPVAARRTLDVRATPYRLVYPDGRHDAESVFVDKVKRPYIITKGFTGGAVYRVPYPLSSQHVNRLVRIGTVAELATDAAMLPDLRHVLVRGYGIAGVYTFPGFQRIGSFDLPVQRQGEGVSAGPGGRLRLSSEGVHSVVIQWPLPAAILARMKQPAASPSPSASPSRSPSPSPSPSPASPSSSVLAPSPSATPSSPAAASSQVRPQPPDTVAGGVTRTRLLWSIPAVILLGAGGIGVGLRRRS